MSAAAVIFARRKRLIRRFREAGATDSGRATTLEALGERRSWIFDQMVRHGAFLPVPGGRFYMDERVAQEFLRQRRQRALLIAAAFLLFWLVAWLIGLVFK